MKNNSAKKAIFLDYNATSPMRSESRKSVENALEQPLNASSVHSYGREGRKIVENAREILAAHIGIPASQIIFNSGATEGNNTVLKHFAGEKILVSAIEHPAVLEASPDAIRIPVTQGGTVDLNELERLLKEHKPALVSVMAVNNETGVIQPIKEAAALTHSNGALFHCDGVQGLGRIELNMPALGIDFLTLSSHKIGGPQGVGALALGLCGETPTLLHGGGQEKSARAGTENVAGIAGFGAAIEAACHNIETEQTRLKAFQTKLETALSKIDGLIIHGSKAQRVGNTTLFSLPGASSETMLMALDLDGIAVSNGSACSSGRVEPSHVLTSMGCGEQTATSALRISTGWNTLESDIDAFLKSFKKIVNRLKGN